MPRVGRAKTGTEKSLRLGGNSSQGRAALQGERCAKAGAPRRAEFHGERIVEMHMQRLGGKEQLLAQVYSAIATRRDDTVELALRAYGAPRRLCVAARALRQAVRQ